MSSKDDIKQVQFDIKDIRENHLGHIRVELEGLKTDIVWVKKFFFIVASSAIGSLATGLLNLFK